MKIKWSVEALGDLQSLFEFVSADNPHAAQKLALTIVNLVETTLPNNPHIGRTGRVNGTRELVVTGTSYIVPYRVMMGELQILRVYHGARRWPKNL